MQGFFLKLLKMYGIEKNVGHNFFVTASDKYEAIILIFIFSLLLQIKSWIAVGLLFNSIQLTSCGSTLTPIVPFSLRPDVQGHPGRHGQEEVRDQVPQDVQRRERRRQHVQLHPGGLNYLPWAWYCFFITFLQYQLASCHQPELDGFNQHFQATVHVPLSSAVD